MQKNGKRIPENEVRSILFKFLFKIDPFSLTYVNYLVSKMVLNSPFLGYRYFADGFGVRLGYEGFFGFILFKKAWKIR